MDIYSGTILVSLVIYIAVGNYAGRRVKKLDDYFVAGRNAPTLLIVGTLVASVLSTNIFLGETGFVYEGQAGPYLLWPPIGAMGYIFGALLLAGIVAAGLSSASTFLLVEWRVPAGAVRPGRGTADGLDCLADDSQVLWLTCKLNKPGHFTALPHLLRELHLKW